MNIVAGNLNPKELIIRISKNNEIIDHIYFYSLILYQCCLRGSVKILNSQKIQI